MRPFIPLLFETGADQQCGVVVVVGAPYAVQKQRVLQRHGANERDFEKLLSQQMPDDEKRKRAGFLIDTSGTLLEAERQIDDVPVVIRERCASP